MMSDIRVSVVKTRGSFRSGAQIVSCRLAAAAVCDDVERHFLSFGEGAHASAFDRTDMNKHIFPAAFRLNEAEAFLVVKSLHNARIHLDILSLQMCTWDPARNVLAAMFRFVDFGEVSEACAPVSNEAKRPSRSAQYRLPHVGV